jgi:hypothetical protein
MQRPFPAWTSFPLLSQETARRNAQRAAIVCAQRRLERDDVARFLERNDAEAGPAVRAQVGGQRGDT